MFLFLLRSLVLIFPLLQLNKEVVSRAYDLD